MFTYYIFKFQMHNSDSHSGEISHNSKISYKFKIDLKTKFCER